MGNESAFDPKNLQTINPERRRDLLEELDLPPQLISFLRKNSRALQIGAVCLILAILGWTAYDHYAEKRRDEAAALLASAIEAPEGEQSELLRRVQAEYGGTGAALWSRVQLAHAAHAAGNEEDAIAGYRAVLADIGAGNPLTPLLHYSLGQSYEAAGQPEEALRHYRQLAAVPGFAAKGLLAEARIHEVGNRPVEAIEAYEQLAALEEQPLLDQGYVANKLAELRAQPPGEQEQQ